MNRLYLILLLSLLFSCTGKEKIPEDVLPPNKMQEVLWDYLRADSYCSSVLKSDSAANDTTKNMIFQHLIFKHHRITTKDFTKSYNFYISHPDLMMPILDSMVSKKSKSDFGNLLKERIRILEK
jgi:hypothetical protein